MENVVTSVKTVPPIMPTAMASRVRSVARNPLSRQTITPIIPTVPMMMTAQKAIAENMAARSGVDVLRCDGWLIAACSVIYPISTTQAARKADAT